MLKKKERKKLIQRLQSQELQVDSVGYQDGFLAGFTWAKDHSTVAGLCNLEHAMAECWEDEELWNDIFVSDSMVEPWVWLAMQLRDTWRGGEVYHSDQREAFDFWGQRIPPDEFLKGFAEGALALCDEIQLYLRGGHLNAL